MRNYTIEYKAGGTYTVIPNINRALKELTPGEFKVYAAIANYARDKHQPGRSFPKQQSLADGTGYSREQVNRYVKELVAKGFITSTPRIEHGVMRGNTYQIMQIESPTPVAAPKQPSAVYEKADLDY